ncbi:MAG: DUF488 family protein [Methanomassiliicoccales archaeon]
MELRKWFSHDHIKWEEFRERYRKELGDNVTIVQKLIEMATRGDTTLIFSARDVNHSSVALNTCSEYKRIIFQTSL